MPSSCPIVFRTSHFKLNMNFFQIFFSIFLLFANFTQHPFADAVQTSRFFRCFRRQSSDSSNDAPLLSDKPKLNTKSCFCESANCRLEKIEGQSGLCVDCEDTFADWQGTHCSMIYCERCRSTRPFKNFWNWCMPWQRWKFRLNKRAGNRKG